MKYMKKLLKSMYQCKQIFYQIIIRIDMQNNSAKICQDQTNKQEKPSPITTIAAQIQKKPVQKVTKNPLMAKKNPLMRSQVTQIKQIQSKPILQPSPAKLVQQSIIKQQEVKPVKVEQKVEQTKEPIVQVKVQNLIVQTKKPEIHQKEVKPQIQIKQEKKQSIEHPKTQIKQNPLTIKKNPLAISQPKAKQPLATVSLPPKTQQKQKVQQAPQPTLKVQEKKDQIAQNKPAQFEPKQEKIKQQTIQTKQTILQKPEVEKVNVSETKIEPENKPSKIEQQKSSQIKQQPKNKEVKVQPQKKSNPLAIKKNPLIKSQMIFKPTQIKQPTNVISHKPLQQPIKKPQNIKPQANKEKRVETIVQNQSQKLTNQQKDQQKKIKVQSKFDQQKILESAETIQQTNSNSKFQNNRFSVGFFSESKDSQKLFKNDVQVKITDSFQKGTALSKYMVYQIQGKDKLGPFHIARKYSQFQAIRKIIRQRWPGCFIPSIHSKSQLKKTELKQKQIRIVLQNFLLGLSYSEHLFYKEEVQLFLRSPEIDTLQMVKQMPVLKAKDLISRYTSCFGEEMFQNIAQSKLSTQIKHFTTVLRKIIASLNNMSEKVQNLSESFDNYAVNLGKFGEIAKVYEQVCLYEYTNNSRDCTIIIKDQTSNISKLKDLARFNPFNKLYSFINNEVRDAQSFLQIIIALELFALRRDELVKVIKENESQISQISLGHKTLKTMATRKTKEQVQSELEAETRKLVEEKDNIVEIYNITEVILAKKEIEYFKSFKRNTYRDVLRQWVNLTKQFHPELEELWKFIQDSSSRALK